MKRHVRIRCPICGMLSWQSRLDKDFEFEVKIQEIGSNGQGKITNKYSTPKNEEGVWILKLALIEKMESVTRKLRQEVLNEQSEDYQRLVREGRIKDAVGVFTIQGDFDTHSVVDVDDVKVVSMPSAVEASGSQMTLFSSLENTTEEVEETEDTDTVSELLWKIQRLSSLSVLDKKADIIARSRSELEEVKKDEKESPSEVKYE